MKKLFRVLLIICIFFAINIPVFAGFHLVDKDFGFNPVLMNDYKIYDMGGWDNLKKKMTPVKIYDLKTKKKIVTNVVMSFPKYGYQCVKLNNSEILVFGGLGHPKDRTIYKAEIFNINSEKFTPVGNTNFEHSACDVIRFDNGYILIVDAIKNIEIFNPVTKTFQIVGKESRKLLNGIRTCEAIKLDDNRAIIVGYYGYPERSKVFIYDLAEDTFTSGGRLLYTRLHPALSLLDDGRVLVSGGWDKTAEIYSPSSQQSVLTGNLKKERRQNHAITLPNGKVLVINGISGNDETLRKQKSAEIYNPKTGKFKYIGKTYGTRNFYIKSEILDSKKVLLLGEYVIEIYKL